MNDITQQIQQLMKQVKQRPDQRKVVNKIYARLEEALLWSEKLEPTSLELADMESTNQTPQKNGSCDCVEGARNRFCPQHGY